MKFSFSWVKPSCSVGLDGAPAQQIRLQPDHVGDGDLAVAVQVCRLKGSAGEGVFAQQMGLQPEECLVIEDSTVGITAGHCAGMTVAALIDNRFPFDRSLADYELNSLEEIVPLAEKIRDLK